MSARVVPRIALGSEGYSVARLLLGGWQLSAGHRADSIDEPSLFARLEAMIDAGFTSFDCADIYTGVEELFGRLRSRVRTPLEIHTKYVPDAGNLEGLRASDVERVIDRSLRRLGVERLDLVQFHWWDYAVPGYVEAAGWLDELRARGKIRHLGLTNFDAERTRELCEAGLPLVAMQAQSSLLDRRVESGMEALAHEFDFQLLCYGTLAGGLLSERFLGRAPEEFEASTRSLTKYRAIVEEAGGWSALQALLEGLRRVAERGRLQEVHREDRRVQHRRRQETGRRLR